MPLVLDGSTGIVEANIANSAVTDAKLSLTANSQEIKDSLNASGSAPIYACRAWVNFNGTTNTGGNCDVAASGNVSSVTDNGVGDYTVNFATPMQDVDYSSIGTNGRAQASSLIISNVQLTSSSVKVSSRYATTNVAQDQPIISIAVFR